MLVIDIQLYRSPRDGRVLVLRGASHRHGVAVRDHHIQPDHHNGESTSHVARNIGYSLHHWSRREFDAFHNHFLHWWNDSSHVSVVEEGPIGRELWEFLKFVRVCCRRQGISLYWYFVDL